MTFEIRRAQAGDLAAVLQGLRALAADLGDGFNATGAQVQQALFGPHPAARAQLAFQGGALVGLAYYSPMFSTMLGGAGCYVSDLWSHESARGQGLGARLLAAVQADAAADWAGAFIKLAAYKDNAAALAFYRKLGFEVLGDEHALRLSGAALQALKDPR
ncbi:MAG: GNAT family N-acetyltransferase [Paracoccaceae bacterium]